MENINFFLKEEESNNGKKYENIKLSSHDVEQFLQTKLIHKDITDTIKVESIVTELQYFYKTTFNVKQITQILTYYGIHKGNSNGKSKMTKDEMIQVLLFFEIDPVNKECVQNRVRLWQNMEELKSDPYFSKFILF
jgi:hypothetical protein